MIHLKMWINLNLSESISTIANLDVTCTLDISCDQLLHLDPPSHLCDPQDISSAEHAEIEFFLNLKYMWTMPTFHQQMFSLGTMIMICSYSIKRLIPHLTISTYRTLMSVKMKMSSSSMPPTLATPLHCHNPTLKTRSPLILQVQYQLLSKPPVITPSIPNVLIT